MAASGAVQTGDGVAGAGGVAGIVGAPWRGERGFRKLVECVWLGRGSGLWVRFGDERGGLVSNRQVGNLQRSGLHGSLVGGPFGRAGCWLFTSEAGFGRRWGAEGRRFHTRWRPGSGRLTIWYRVSSVVDSPALSSLFRPVSFTVTGQNPLPQFHPADSLPERLRITAELLAPAIHGSHSLQTRHVQRPIVVRMFNRHSVSRTVI